MIMMKFLSRLFAFSLILSSSYAGVQDSCVADYTASQGPAGYSCENPENVTVNDFVYSAPGVPGNTSIMIKTGITTAISSQFPGLHGIGLSLALAC
ncbi:hypothetical protein M0R45_003670 [Rubus argutus]|uniref:Uncharacterized protein n=1 Tax=Rubus argutus TaxID=59490 RepID=A0AAW1YH72_RUBAR